MASRVTGRLINSLKGRVYSTQAVPQRTPDFGLTNLQKQSVKLSKLSNSLQVASWENNAPISRVAVVVDAGARYETGDDLGISHCLRTVSGLSTKDASNFAIAANIQQAGATLNVTSTKEYIIYEVTCLRNRWENIAMYLRHIISSPSYKVWEVKAAQSPMNLDLAMLSEQNVTQVMENLHSAAFQNTLGRSLYAPKFKVGKYSPDQLRSYTEQNFTSRRISVVGLGVEHDDLRALAKKFDVSDGPGAPKEKALYISGQSRVDRPGDMAHVAVATQGLSLGSEEILSSGVLQMLMGTGVSVKYGRGDGLSMLGKAIGKETKKAFSYSSISANYTDNGLFGFYVAGDAQDMDTVLPAAYREFAKLSEGGGITDADVARAKQLLKVSLYSRMESSDNVLADLIEQSAGLQRYVAVEDLAGMIDKITTADVVGVAKKLASGKPSMAAVGNLATTPYLNELS